MINSYAILNNMYYQGSVSHDNMAALKINDYIIEISREEVKKEFLNIQYVYRCNIVFKDLLGREVMRLSINEGQANALIDNINTFIHDNYSELCVLAGITSSSMFEEYSVFLYDYEEHEDYQAMMKIMCYNSVTKSMQPVFSTMIEFDQLDELASMMFFIFLIDLESNRDGIFQV